jgi:hypothetical protein
MHITFGTAQDDLENAERISRNPSKAKPGRGVAQSFSGKHPHGSE